MTDSGDKKAAPFERLFVLGGGAWGTALAALCAGNGVKTAIWAREDEVVSSINAGRGNNAFLPGVALPATLTATRELAMARDADAILFVVPAQHARAILPELKIHASLHAPIALCSKGIEIATGLLLTEVLGEIWPEARPAVLSGPSFARDVATGKPTAVTLACADPALGPRWMATISARHFRPYLSDDLVGAELGGAVKNVLAIAAGVVTGLELGDSARAALITRGFAEVMRLGVAIGAKRETLHGLSGLGDLILTAGSAQSRNMSLGVELGRGRALSDILGERNTVSEGVATASAVVKLADTAGVEMPICRAVAELVSERKTVSQVLEDLLSRPLKGEID